VTIPQGIFVALGVVTALYGITLLRLAAAGQGQSEVKFVACWGSLRFIAGCSLIVAALWS